MEHILFKGACFKLTATNIYNNHICFNHFKNLSSNGGNNGRCKTCKLICNRETSSNNGVRRVSKELALAIWERGQPQENWAFFNEPICDQCRKYIAANFVSDKIRSECNHIFGNM